MTANNDKATTAGALFQSEPAAQPLQAGITPFNYFTSVSAVKPTNTFNKSAAAVWCTPRPALLRIMLGGDRDASDPR